MSFLTRVKETVKMTATLSALGPLVGIVSLFGAYKGSTLGDGVFRIWGYCALVGLVCWGVVSTIGNLFGIPWFISLPILHVFGCFAFSAWCCFAQGEQPSWR